MIEAPLREAREQCFCDNSLWELAVERVISNHPRGYCGSLEAWVAAVFDEHIALETHLGMKLGGY